MNDLSLYKEFRPQMDTWDMLLHRTFGGVSTIIHAWSPFNHAGAVLRLPEYEGEENRRWTLEAVGGGVRLAHLSEVLEKANGEVWWHQLKPEFNHLRNAAGCWGLTKAGVVDYDLLALLRMPLGKVRMDAARMLCTEYWVFGAVESGMVKVDYIPRPSRLPDLGITLPGICIVKSEPRNDLPQVVQP